MATTDYILIGGGDQAKVTAEIILQQGDRIVAVYDRRPCEPLPGLVSIGDYDNTQFPDAKAIISIGGNIYRKNYAGRLNHTSGVIAHPSAIISPSSVIGAGSVVMQGSMIQTLVKIGSHVIINTRSSVDHDCEIGDFVHIAPGAVLCGRVTVGEGTLIGAGAVLLPGVRIGRWAQVSAGAVVFRDVQDGGVVIGNPARVIKVESLSQ
jgi:acetyltransferase EpsM